MTLELGARTALLASLMASAAGWLINLAIVCIVALLIYYFGAKLLGKTIETAITTFDSSFLGVEITFADLQISVGGGWILIKDGIVHNPPGRGFKSDYLLNVGEVKVDV